MLPHEQCNTGNNLSINGGNSLSANIELSILHLNVQCLSNKVNLLEVLSQRLKVNILCIDEHWLSNEKLLNTFLGNFELIDCFCRVERLHGGSAIFVHESLSSWACPIDLSDYSVEMTIECSCIKLGYFCLIDIYRPPNGDFEIFIKVLNAILFKTTSRFNCVVICGDLNIDALKKSNQCKILHDLLDSYQPTSFH